MAENTSVAERNGSATDKRTKRSQFASWLAMTSYRQIEANRRNAIKSTGPKAEVGKQVSRCNALRHGLTAETVISALEDAEDYKAFETAITADYDAQSAVERELVLRLASVLWRLRRATTMESGLFELQAAYLRHRRPKQPPLPDSSDVVRALFRSPRNKGAAPDGALTIPDGALTIMEEVPDSGNKADAVNVVFARCFLQLANLPNLALDRLNRYEATLVRQATRVIYVLQALDRRKPQERRRSSWFPSEQDIEDE
jgi:hypothetical protein